MKISFLAAIILFSATCLVAGPAYAQLPNNNQDTSRPNNNQDTPLPNNNQYTPPPPNPSSNFSLKNPLEVETICGFIQKILSGLLFLGGPIAALFLVLAGLKFVTAQGSSADLKKARENLFFVVIGIGIFLGAWLFGQVIANTLRAINPSNVGTLGSCK